MAGSHWNSVMYHHYPNSHTTDGSFTAEDVRRGLVTLHTDYHCPFCGKWQAVAAMGGYGGRCIQCGRSSDPAQNEPRPA